MTQHDTMQNKKMVPKDLIPDYDNTVYLNVSEERAISGVTIYIRSMTSENGIFLNPEDGKWWFTAIIDHPQLDSIWCVVCLYPGEPEMQEDTEDDDDEEVDDAAENARYEPIQHMSPDFSRYQ